MILDIRSCRGSRWEFHVDMRLRGVRGCAVRKSDNFSATSAGFEPAAAGTGAPAALPSVPSHAIPAVYSGYQWGSPGSAVTVTYSFLTSVPAYYPANAERARQLRADERRPEAGGR